MAVQTQQAADISETRRHRVTGVVDPEKHPSRLPAEHDSLLPGMSMTDFFPYSEAAHDIAQLTRASARAYTRIRNLARQTESAHDAGVQLRARAATGRDTACDTAGNRRAGTDSLRAAGQWIAERQYYARRFSDHVSSLLRRYEGGSSTGLADTFFQERDRMLASGSGLSDGVKAQLASLTDPAAACSPQAGRLPADGPEVAEDTGALAAGSGSEARAEGRGMADNEFWAYIQGLMTTLDTDYLSVYEYAVARQTAYWKDFTSLQAEALPTVKDDTDFIFPPGFAAYLEDNMIFTKMPYFPSENTNNYILYPVQTEGVTTTDEEDAIKWANELGVPLGCVMEHNGGYFVTLDYFPIQGMLTDLEDLFFSHPVEEGVGTVLNSAEYQAWLTTFNAHADNLKTNSQTMATKYSNANATYDTVIKLLSSTITTMMEAARAVLNALR